MWAYKYTWWNVVTRELGNKIIPFFYFPSSFLNTEANWYSQSYTTIASWVNKWHLFISTINPPTRSSFSNSPSSTSAVPFLAFFLIELIRHSDLHTHNVRCIVFLTPSDYRRHEPSAVVSKSGRILRCVNREMRPNPHVQGKPHDLRDIPLVLLLSLFDGGD